jgi:transcriptional regulator with XRE-family HTH domain
MPDGHLILRRQVSPEHVALGRAVRELRVRRGMSQEELGDRGDVHRNYVGALERGETNPTFRVLLKVEHGLSVPLTELAVCYERQLADWW